MLDSGNAACALAVGFAIGLSSSLGPSARLGSVVTRGESVPAPDPLSIPVCDERAGGKLTRLTVSKLSEGAMPITIMPVTPEFVADKWATSISRACREGDFARSGKRSGSTPC